MNDELVEIGSWGEDFKLVRLPNKKLALLSSKEIFEDAYKNPVIPGEENKFVKLVKASYQISPGVWAYLITSSIKLIEIFRKFSKQGIPFKLNQPAKNPKEARDIDADIDADIDVLANLSILALPQ